MYYALGLRYSMSCSDFTKNGFKHLHLLIWPVVMKHCWYEVHSIPAAACMVFPSTTQVRMTYWSVWMNICRWGDESLVQIWRLFPVAALPGFSVPAYVPLTSAKHFIFHPNIKRLNFCWIFYFDGKQNWICWVKAWVSDDLHGALELKIC